MHAKLADIIRLSVCQNLSRLVYDIRLIINETYRQSHFDTFKTISWAFSGKLQDIFSLLGGNLSTHDLAWGDSAELKRNESS
jgi:hypothetical protein